jgi:hypothetical protein
MKWMEVINLRTAENNLEFIEPMLTKLITEIANTGGMKDIKMYRGAVLENDACIHIHWASRKAELQGSATGLCVVHILKEFGMVSHSVWVEENNKLKERCTHEK